MKDTPLTTDCQEPEEWWKMLLVYWPTAGGFIIATFI